MKLTRITISGADDGAPHQALIDLSREFPFVEWGLLLSRTKQGTPRYPSADWLVGFEADEDEVAISHHLCGAMAREVMSGRVPARLRPTETKVSFKHIARRAQLNGFSDYVLPGLHAANLLSDTEFILQCGSLEAVERAEKLRAVHSNVSALWDCSGGRGLVLDAWPLPLGDLRIGYAGGISETNVSALLTKLTANREPHEFWIDMESGVRTGDKLDLAKVRRILELVEPFVSP